MKWETKDTKDMIKSRLLMCKKWICMKYSDIP